AGERKALQIGAATFGIGAQWLGYEVLLLRLQVNEHHGAGTASFAVGVRHQHTTYAPSRALLAPDHGGQQRIDITPTVINDGGRSQPDVCRGGLWVCGRG